MMLYCRIPLVSYAMFLVMVVANMISLPQAAGAAGPSPTIPPVPTPTPPTIPPAYLPAPTPVSTSRTVIKNIIHIFTILLSPFSPHVPPGYFTSLKYRYLRVRQCLVMEPLLMKIPIFLQEYL